MRDFYLLLVLLLCVSCEVTEKISIDTDGSGSIEIDIVRNENSYMQIAEENYSKEDVYKDTTYVFGDYIKKHEETFSRISVADQNVFLKYAQVKVHEKQSSYEKVFRTTYTQNFTKTSDIVDLSKTEHYLSDIINNYALSAEEHYFDVSYRYANNRFKRIVTITDTVQLKKEFAGIEKWKKKYGGFKLVQKYVFDYHFPRKIQSVSNPLAVISEDKKALKLAFSLLDYFQNPLITNLEVVIDPEIVN